MKKQLKAYKFQFEYDSQYDNTVIIAYNKDDAFASLRELVAVERLEVFIEEIKLEKGLVL